jgi:hypothetical protein
MNAMTWRAHLAPVAALLLTGTCSLVVAQVLPQAIGQPSKRNPDRERWQMAGRRTPGANSAMLRNLAIQQKIRMRAARTGAQAASASGGAWISLGPLPLPSDASGIGLQDYGWVSGRATAVAIDPDDASGNTVYVGGAHGGVWKSSNAGPASPNPASVVWTPLTDGEATLAVGTIAIQPQQVSAPDPANSVVLVGTGETDNSEDSYYGLSILRSTDAVKTWSLYYSRFE